ncbi:MAG: class II fumarate hydratase [Bacteroidales bacterium]|nr:class II fumarate hydratase [Bacteroidales bacterium]
MKIRIEKDSMGEINVSEEKYWAAQTQRSFENFKIGDEKMPLDLIKAMARVKKAASFANFKCGIFDENKMKSIHQVCDEIINEDHNDQFPLVIWQTGSGTQTNMNLNEVISNRIQFLKYGEIGKQALYVHPNDDVNKSQSTNDVFPTAMRVAAYKTLQTKTIPELRLLQKVFSEKALSFANVVKTGRTHMMDATPVTLGQEMKSFADQLKTSLELLIHSSELLTELPIGGTATGSELNAPKNYDVLAAEFLSKETGFSFKSAECKATHMATLDSFVHVSSGLKNTAVSLMKIANDIRLLASGPRCGLGEIHIPANEPGSSIMPGKVNPTQVEAMTMVCAQIMGNDYAITIGGMQGHLQLNVFMPLIIRNILHSAHILADSCRSFRLHCVDGIEPNLPQIKEHLNNSLMLVTALNPHIGYSNAAKIAQKALCEDLTLKEAALQSGISENDFDTWVDPYKMV